MSADTTNLLDRDGAYSMRSVPVRIYLPDGPVIQEVAPPLREDGKKIHTLSSFLSEFVYPPLQFIGTPLTLSQFFSNHLPLLFPPRPPPPPPSRLNPNPQAPFVRELAYVLIQGVVSPLEAELAWLSACLAGADGWLNICIAARR